MEGGTLLGVLADGELQYLYKRCTFVFAFSLGFSRHSHAASLFTDGEQKNGCIVTYLIHLKQMLAPFTDVTATDCWAQNGSPYGRAFVTFKRRRFTN